MHTIIHTQGIVLTDCIRAHLMRRFTVAMSEFGNHVSRVEVHLEKRETGADDKVVSVVVRPMWLSPIEIDTAGPDLYVAISIAARRSRRAVKRALRRQQQFDRDVSASPSTAPRDCRPASASTGRSASPNPSTRPPRFPTRYSPT